VPSLPAGPAGPAGPEGPAEPSGPVHAARVSNAPMATGIRTTRACTGSPNCDRWTDLGASAARFTAWCRSSAGSPYLARARLRSDTCHSGASSRTKAIIRLDSRERRRGCQGNARATTARPSSSRPARRTSPAERLPRPSRFRPWREPAGSRADVPCSMWDPQPTPGPHRNQARPRCLCGPEG